MIIIADIHRIKCIVGNKYELMQIPNWVLVTIPNKVTKYSITTPN